MRHRRPNPESTGHRRGRAHAGSPSHAQQAGGHHTSITKHDPKIPASTPRRPAHQHRHAEHVGTTIDTDHINSRAQAEWRARYGHLVLK